MDAKVKVVAPYGSSGCKYRQRNFDYVTDWIRRQHPEWPITVGTSDRTPFSPAQARNSGAVGDWDVCVFWDVDTIAHPDAVREAAAKAADSRQLVIASDAHMYMDELSTDRFFDTGLMFPKPCYFPGLKTGRQPRGQEFDHQGIYRKPCSGILAVSRELWTATGGYIDSLGGEDSHEDLCFFAQAQIFGDGVTWIEGITLHLFHPPANRVNGVNQQHYQNLVGMIRHPDRARQYLSELGHKVPWKGPGGCANSPGV